MYDFKTVKNVLETAIDSLIDNFLAEPYIHRCEHSIHCELYNMLSVHRVLQGLYPFRNGEVYKTSLIHKEWPETIARPEKNGRRGNFDIAILEPDMIQKYTLGDFYLGRIPPAFVVELGLNYKLNHLASDYEKLKNSNVNQGYLIHLWQPHKGIKNEEITSLKGWVSGKSNVAIAVFTKQYILKKHLNDSNITMIDYKVK